MALHAQDLREPDGVLDAAALWPQYGATRDDEVEKALNQYLVQGYALADAVTDTADQDEAARQWAYHRAYDQAYQRLVLMPSSVATSDEGSASYTGDQIVQLGLMAERALARHLAIVAAPSAVAVVLNRASESHALGFTW